MAAGLIDCGVGCGNFVIVSEGQRSLVEDVGVLSWGLGELKFGGDGWWLRV